MNPFRLLLPLFVLTVLLGAKVRLPAQAPPPAGPPWVSVGPLNVPAYAYTFLTTTPSGDLVVAVHNNRNEAGNAPLLLIRQPTSANPSLQAILSLPFDAQRGYSGLACDATGNLFVAIDTGNEATSSIRKFLPNGAPDPRFGNRGEVIPGRRVLGIDVVGEYLLAALNWGQIVAIRSVSGQPVGFVPPPPQAFFLRDIAVDPGSMRVFGVAEGSIYVWEDGTPWQPQSYRLRRLTTVQGQARASEGISLDGIARTAMNVPIPGNVLLTIDKDGTMTRSMVASAQPDSELTDSALSFDGRTLFLSDVRKNQIHVMRRQAALASGNEKTVLVTQAEAGGVAATPVPTPEVTHQTTTKWYRSYLGIVEDARTHRKPMLVYFRSSRFPLCAEFERTVLLTPAFDQAAAGRVVCVFEDVANDPLIAYRLGVVRVPHVEIFDSRGETHAKLSGQIDPTKLTEAILSVR